MNLFGMRLGAGLTAIVMMAWPNEPQFYAACGTLFLVAGSIALQILKNRRDERREIRAAEETEKRYQRDRQERLDHQQELKDDLIRQAANVARVAIAQADRVAGVAIATAEDLRVQIQANTELTADVGIRADAAYDAANHTNEKLGFVASKKLDDIDGIVGDTNATAHRIEERVAEVIDAEFVDVDIKRA